MNRDQIIAAMEAMLAVAEGEGRDLTADEVAEYDKLKGKLDAVDAMAERRKGVVGLRQTSGIAAQAERAALRPDESLASLFPRAAGETRRIGDFVQSALGMRSEQIGAAGSQGGFTVPNFLSAEILDLARAKSRLVQAGARTIPVAGVTSFATVESDPSFSGHAENASISETEIVFGSRRFQPYTSVAIIRASIELVEDSPNFSSLIENVIAATNSVQWDALGLNGTGVGQQLGILNQEGVTEIDGSNFDTWRPFSRAYQAVNAANYTPGAFITSPGVVGSIDDLVDTTGQPLARPPSLANAQFLDTTSIASGVSSPANSAAVTGQWDQLFFAVRTPLTIEVTRVGGDAFSKMSVLVRAYSRIDSFAVRNAAFAKVTGIPVAVAG